MGNLGHSKSHRNTSQSNLWHACWYFFHKDEIYAYLSCRFVPPILNSQAQDKICISAHTNGYREYVRIRAYTRGQSLQNLQMFSYSMKGYYYA